MIDTIFGQTPIIYMPVALEKKPISIIITAYRTQDYIEQCLDSIEKQTYFIDNDNYEILVGIDNCYKTFNKLSKIKNNYRNLRVFMMNSNEGTYVTTNTLLSLVKHENIPRFDSDDWMHEAMINEIMLNSYEEFVRFFYYNCYENEIKRMYIPAEGVVFYTKALLNNLGGYLDWKCGADSEFYQRISKIKKQFVIRKPLFYRRIHDASLTRSAEFGFNSEIRKSYREMRSSGELKIIPKVNTYIEYGNVLGVTYN